jgi:hypothetical protein
MSKAVVYSKATDQALSNVTHGLFVIQIDDTPKQTKLQIYFDLVELIRENLRELGVRGEEHED